MATLKKLGPYGSDEGAAFDIVGSKLPKQLLEIDIWSIDGPNGKINAIAFTYRDEKSDTVKIGPVGTEDGTKHKIPIKEGEYLTVISGYFGPYITSLNFLTSTPPTYGTYGRYPNTGETSFSIDVDHDSVVALSGRYNNQIRAIGAYSGPCA